MVLLIMRSRECLRFGRALRLEAAREDAPSTLLVEEAAAELGAPGVPVFITSLVGAPALHGLLRPKLLFPRGLVERLTPGDIQLIVAHELSHLRRGDLCGQALIQVSQVIHWFNPMVWVAARVAQHDCELACDEHAVRRLGSLSKQAYGATLLKILGMATRGSRVPLGVGIVESKNQMKWRIQMIIESKRPSVLRSSIGWALLCSLAALGLTRESRADPQASAAPAVTAKAPAGWWKNGDQTASYDVGVDFAQTHDGQPSAYVKSIVPKIEGFGGMMQMCSAKGYLGKRLRYSAWMRTENASDNGAHLWFRVDGKESSQMLQFDNMDKRPVIGTTPWQQYSIVLDVPDNSEALAYGFFISGTGQAWVSGVRIEEVGTDVPSTNMAGKGRNLPEAPVNLGFAATPELKTVPFSLGDRNFKDGDTISIDEILGSSPRLRTGDTVVVRGRYTLASQDGALLMLELSRTKAPFEEAVAPRQKLKVNRGTGTFELRYEVRAEGHLHVSFYATGPKGDAFGGVYFGPA